MKRLYTFGCSFTQYSWPTWADILGREFNHYENWGMTGGGNQFIFNSLIECLSKNDVTKNDTIVVMWSDIVRVDYYCQNSWRPSGNLFLNKNDDLYGDSFVKNLNINYDFRGFLLRDLAFIEAARQILLAKKCNFIFLSMVPLGLVDLINKSTINIDADILETYLNTLQSIKPSVFEVVYNNDWFSKDHINFTYNFSYHERTLLENLEKNYNHIKGTDWPDFSKLYKSNFLLLNPRIKDELMSFDIIQQLLEIKKMQKDTKKFYKKICKVFNVKEFLDFHPLPMQHLSYIENFFKISHETKQWVNEIHCKLLNNELVQFTRHQPIRL